MATEESLVEILYAIVFYCSCGAANLIDTCMIVLADSFLFCFHDNTALLISLYCRVQLL